MVDNKEYFFDGDSFFFLKLIKHCVVCRKVLVGKQSRFCGGSCADRFWFARQKRVYREKKRKKQ